MTAQEASVVVAMLMAAYPNARLPDGTVLAYESFLAELERDQTTRAVRVIIRTSKFMPTIAEIVTAYEAQITRHRRVLREWVPDRDPPDCMKPKELAAACHEFLGGFK